MITSRQTFDILPDARAVTPPAQSLNKNDTDNETTNSFDKVLANKCDQNSDETKVTNHKQEAPETTTPKNVANSDENSPHSSTKKLKQTSESGNNLPLQGNIEGKSAVFTDSITSQNLESQKPTDVNPDTNTGVIVDANIDVNPDTNTGVTVDANMLNTNDIELDLEIEQTSNTAHNPNIINNINDEASADIPISAADHMLQLINQLHEPTASLPAEHRADINSSAMTVINTPKTTDKKLNLETAPISNNINNSNITTNLDGEILEDPAVLLTDNILAQNNTLHEPAELLTSELNTKINDNPLAFNNTPKLTTAKTDGASVVKIIPEVTSSNKTIQTPSFADAGADIEEQELITEEFHIDKKIKKDFNLNPMKFGQSNISSKLMKNAVANPGVNINNTSVEQLTESISAAASLGQANTDAVAQLAANTSQLSGIGLAKGIPTMAVPIPLDSPNWGEAVAKRIVLMATNGIKTVQLQLNPQDLGPMEVNINITKDQASINFNSQHVVVREALEANMQRLKEMFDAAGIDLVDVNVSDQSFAQQNESEFNGDSSSSSTENQLDDMGDENAAPINMSLSTNAVDFYA